MKRETSPAALNTRADELPAASLLFKRLFESATDAIVLLDNQDRVLRVNMAFTEMFGYAGSECIGHDLNGLIVDETFEDEASGISGRVRAGERVRQESLRRNRDGELLHVEISGIPVHSESGQVGVFGIYRDITAQRNAEDLLRQSEGTYRDIVESLDDGYFELDQNGVLTFGNRALFRMLELDASPEGAVQALDFVACRSRCKIMLRFGRLLRSGNPCPAFGFELLAADGAARHAEVTMSPLCSNNGGVAGCRGVIRDATQRVRMDQALADAEAAYRLVALNTGQLVYDYDLSSGNIRWLGAIHAVLGCRPEATANIDIDEWARRIHPEDLEPALKLLERERRRGGHYESEYRFERTPGEFIVVSDRGSFLSDADGRPCRMIGTMTDVTERCRMERELEWQARHDALTGLYNRHKFQEDGEKLLARPASEGAGHCLLYIDLDQFKLVNDNCGHHAGDDLLRQLADLLKSSVRGTDLLARLGGDEFALLLGNCPLERAEQVAAKLIARIEAFAFVWEGRRFQLGASMGLVSIPPGQTLTDALRMADQACYIAKENGRNQVHVHQCADLEKHGHGRQVNAAQAVTEALAEDRFRLYYQRIEPLVDDESSSHIEILLRMVGRSGEIIPPVEFIPAAERFNQIARLDRWVISRTLSGMQRARDAGQLRPDDRVSINLSGATFGQPQFLEFVQQQFEQTGIDPKNVCFEITESSTISRLSDALVFMRTVREMGCVICLDDFGSGFSSFGYLQMLPVDGLKIDGSLVRGIGSNAVGQAMVRGIAGVAHAAGILCVAEQVENQSDCDLLSGMGVDYIQGYLVHRPEPWRFDPGIAGEDPGEDQDSPTNSR
ncbi:MAG: EAL domain-containing protein [Wenzhouxiangellaceae bacterium]